MLGYGGPGAGYDTASHMCAALGGKVADVSSNEMMVKVGESISKLRKRQNWLEVWISSRYEVGVVSTSRLLFNHLYVISKNFIFMEMHCILQNCRQRHCFNLSGFFRAVGDRQEARGF